MTYNSLMGRPLLKTVIWFSGCSSAILSTRYNLLFWDRKPIVGSNCTQIDTTDLATLRHFRQSSSSRCKKNLEGCTLSMCDRYLFHLNSTTNAGLAVATPCSLRTRKLNLHVTVC